MFPMAQPQPSIASELSSENVRAGFVVNSEIWESQELSTTTRRSTWARHGSQFFAHNSHCAPFTGIFGRSLPFECWKTPEVVQQVHRSSEAGFHSESGQPEPSAHLPCQGSHLASFRSILGPLPSSFACNLPMSSPGGKISDTASSGNQKVTAVNISLQLLSLVKSQDFGFQSTKRVRPRTRWRQETVPLGGHAEKVR